MFIGISATFSDTGNSKDRHTKQNHDPKYTPFPRGKIGQLMFLNEAEDDDLSKKHCCAHVLYVSYMEATFPQSSQSMQSPKSLQSPQSQQSLQMNLAHLWVDF